MTPESIFDALKKAGNAEKSLYMSAYMKCRFPFLGINKPERSRLCGGFLKERKRDQMIDWELVGVCFAQEEREFHYLALDYLSGVSKLLQENDICKLEKLIITKSWWDSVDSISVLVGGLVMRCPQLKNLMREWGERENIWLRRVAIIFQLKYKNRTDRELLSHIISKNLATKEFFIDKAIGWALREYSKTDQEWVQEFINGHQLSRLSIREGSKYLL